MNTEHAFSALIGDIYDCTLEPGRWPQALGRVARFLGCERTLISLSDLQHDRVLIEQRFGCEPEWIAARDRHLPEVHAALQSWFAPGRDADEPFVASRALSPSYTVASPYVRECLQPLGIVDVAHYFLIRSHSYLSEIVLLRHASAGPFTPDVLERGRLLLPHLRRAVTISKVLDAKTIAHRQLAQSLDALPCAVLLTDGRGTIAHANRAAGEILAQGQWLADAQGTLRARRAAADRELQRALRLCAGDEARLGAVGAAIGLSAPGSAPVHAHVLPLCADTSRAQPGSPVVAAIFVATAPDHGAHAAAFASAHALTRAEARVVHALLAGHTLAEVARAFGVGRATVKSQLDSVFQKAGVARQADLVRAVLQFAAPPVPAPLDVRRSAPRAAGGVA